jgi:hypothetical protein
MLGREVDLELLHEAQESLPKRDSGQLHDSLQWFRDAYPTRIPTPIMVANASAGHEKAHFPTGTRVITSETLSRLLTAVENFIAALTKEPANQWTANRVAQPWQQSVLDFIRDKSATRPGLMCSTARSHLINRRERPKAREGPAGILLYSEEPDRRFGVRSRFMR